MTEVIRLLNAWFGIHHKVSLVDRHESNGVEGTNKQILRHVKTLVHDERANKRWGHPTYYLLVKHVINASKSSETGFTPYELEFGSADAKYFTLPDGPDLPIGDRAPQFLKQLDSDLKRLRQMSKKFQDEIVAERSKTNRSKQNCFQPGDYVLFQRNPDQFLPNKLASKFTGPFVVLKQHKNDVEARHMAMGDVRTMHVSRLKIFHGGEEDAREMAMIDADQFAIERFLAYRGDPETRTTMEFEVQFQDGDKLWLPWSKDLFATVQYEHFCRENRPLFPLVYGGEEARVRISAMKKSVITEVEPGDKVFVDLRSYGYAWYSTLGLPDHDHAKYVVQYEYLSWGNKANHHTINARCLIFDEKWNKLDNYFVFTYGFEKEFKDNMTLIDEEFIKKHPQVLPESNRSEILESAKQRS
jgi:hypothetical protein